jgi:hypothetical protein
MLQFQEAVGRSLQSTSFSLASGQEDKLNLHKRVQDRWLIEMIDEGCCLSMHQPWASLLVAGIKLYVLKQQLSVSYSYINLYCLLVTHL